MRQPYHDTLSNVALIGHVGRIKCPILGLKQGRDGDVVFRHHSVQHILTPRSVGSGDRDLVELD